MPRTLCLSCNTCTAESDIHPATTMVRIGEIGRAVVWRCPACQATQWTTLPGAVRAAIAAGARQVAGQRPYLVTVDGVCGRTSLIPLRDLFTYPKTDVTMVLWHCGACRADRASMLPDASEVFRIVQAGGTAMSAAEGAMIELLATDDYQPHAAMQVAFSTTEGPHEHV
jgi:hypothetical protein